MCAGAIIMLVIQTYLRAPSIMFLGELFGIGGLITVLDEVNEATIGNEVGMVMVIAMVVVIIYSTINVVFYYWPDKRIKV